MPNSNSSFQTDSNNPTDSIVQNGGTILTTQRGAFVQANAQRQAIIQERAGVVSVYNSVAGGWWTPGTSVYNNVSVTNAPGYPGTAIVNNGATMNHAVITNDGVTTANAGALIWGGTVSDGGVVNGGGTVYLNGGTMDGQLGNGVAGGNNINIGGTIYVNNGGTLQNGTAYAWANSNPANGVITNDPQSSLLSVGNGGTVLHESIWQGASAVFGSGAQGTDITINVGTAVIENGARITGLNVAKAHYHYNSDDLSNTTSGGVDLTGQATVQSGAVVNGGSVSYAGTLIMDGTGKNIIVDAQYGIAGTEIVQNGGLNVNGTVSNGGIISVGNLGMLQDGLIGSGGILSVADGGSIKGNATLNLGGTAFITPDAGGAIYVNGADGNTGVVLGNLANAVSNGATTIVTTEIRHFDDTEDGFPPANYTAPQYDPVNKVWTGGDSDGIVLQGVQSSDIKGIYNAASNPGMVPADLQKYLTGDNKGNYALIQTTSGGWIVLHIDGIGDRGVIGIDNKGDLVFEVCYLEGTHILTPQGYKKIEDLYPGDLVTTAHPDGTRTGEALPLKWVGKKKLWVKAEDANLPPDEAGYAVRIKKNAFGDNLPEKDLWVTPEHSFLFEGKFVPVRMLINGKTIAYDYERTAYTYYHLETDPHSILIAEGALSESYLDTGNRSHFISVLEPHSNADSSILRFPPKLPLPANANKSWQDAAAPFDTSRAFVEPIWKQLAQRANLNGNMAGALTNALGEAITHESDFTVLFKLPNGKKASLICKSHFQNGQVHSYIFALPPADLLNSPSVILSSRKGRPCDAVGPYVDDRRQLGVLIRNITFVTDQAQYSPHDWYRNETLEGWANLENTSLRWTLGEAILPLPTSWKEIKAIKIEIIAQGPYLLPAENIPKEKIA